MERRFKKFLLPMLNLVDILQNSENRYWRLFTQLPKDALLIWTDVYKESNTIEAVFYHDSFDVVCDRGVIPAVRLIDKGMAFTRESLQEEETPKSTTEAKKRYIVVFAASEGQFRLWQASCQFRNLVGIDILRGTDATKGLPLEPEDVIFLEGWQETTDPPVGIEKAFGNAARSVFFRVVLPCLRKRYTIEEMLGKAIAPAMRAMLEEARANEPTFS